MTIYLFLIFEILLWDIQAGKWDTRAFWEAIFMSVLAVAQWIPIQRLSLVNRGALPYIPLHAGNRSEKQSLTHIWLLVISLVTSSSVLQISNTEIRIFNREDLAWCCWFIPVILLTQEAGGPAP
jgi:hypothetical protein